MTDWADPHKVITFYSYKGGTGRSMALANAAWILASNGKRVLVIDWDLEAPGLHRYFQPFIVDADLIETDGLIDYLWSVTGAILTPEAERPSRRALPNLLDYRICIDWPFEGGSIDFIPAGRQGANYPQRVNSFDWANFYERLGGGRILQRLRETLRKSYDYVLIDSRTGVSDTAGICTVQMPDVLVGLFTLNNQSMEGVAAVLESALALRAESGDGPLRVFPVVSRVEDGEQDKLVASRSRCRAVFSRFIESSTSAREYWDDMELPYKKFYAYEEVLATFGDQAGESGSKSSLLSAIERLARRVTGLRELAMPALDEEERRMVLTKYAEPETSIIDDRPQKIEHTKVRDFAREAAVALSILGPLIVAIAVNWNMAIGRAERPSDYTVLKMIALLGALGGALLVPPSVHLGRYQVRLRLKQYITHALVGAGVAALVCLSLLGLLVEPMTLVSPRASLFPESLNLLAAYTLAALAGLFSDNVIKSLLRAIEALMKVARAS